MACDKKINNIIFTGPKPYTLISKYLFASDILLALWSKKVPTMNYCSPLKLFEYMASGKIILAHDFITIREVIDHKKTGYLVNPDNISFLINALRDILSDEKYLHMGINARKLVFNKYSWNKRAKLIIDKILNN